MKCALNCDGNSTICSVCPSPPKLTTSRRILPVMLESAQSDVSPAKRAAALRFFHSLHQEWHRAGSYLDSTSARDSPHAGPNGPGGSVASHPPPASALPGLRPLLRNRALRRSARGGELLRYWVEASAACTVPGAFSDDRSDGAIASRAVLSASAAIRPALRQVAEKIGSADDAGALRLYVPVMRMAGGVLRRLFDPRADGGGGGVVVGQRRGQTPFEALASNSLRLPYFASRPVLSRARPHTLSPTEGSTGRTTSPWRTCRRAIR